MQDYDTVLKLLLRKSAGLLLRQLTHAPIRRWLNVEFPKTEQRRVDLLGETTEGGLEHIELQSQNDSRMPFRMLEYRMGIYRHHGRFPRQTVLYAGRDKLSMPAFLEVDDLSFRYRLVDVSELDSEPLLASEDIGDNILAILAHLGNEGEAIRSIIGKIARLNSPDRQDAVSQLLIVSGLRALAEEVKELANHMPITENILDHAVIGPAYKNGLRQGYVEGQQQGLRKGLEEGLQQGLVKGEHEGRLKGYLEGERAVLRRLLEKRFGALPLSASKRLDQSSSQQLEELGARLLDASSIEELFGSIR